ncbi:MAG TPA: hypothetical protein VN696_10635 [Pyrinomonadaceae bacterium]|nr:hypothetical protein [Pyrinomonadaceae bacterium]
MTPNPTEFNRGVVAPMECIKEGWALIKDEYWLFFGITLVGILIGGLVPVVLLGPMMVGIFLCLQQRQRNQPVDFGLLFKGFDLFVPGLIVAVVKMIPIFIVLIPYYIFIFAMMAAMPRGRSSADDSPQFVFTLLGFELLFAVVIIAVSILVEIFFMFAFPLVADRKMSGLDAVKLSIKAGRANIGGILGLMLLNALFSIVGLLACIVGVYFYLPIAIASQAVAYRRVFPDAGQFEQYPPPPPPQSWAA